MRHEIRSATYFLADLLRVGQSLTDLQLDTFRGNLEELLRKHYQQHWFPERPTKGSGYRCIRINHKMDPLIAQAAKSCGVSDSSLLRTMFPSELTLWIDPSEVSYRIGENGSICVIYNGNTTSSTNTNITTSITTSKNINTNNNISGSPNKRVSSPNNNHHHHNNHHHQQQQQHQHYINNSHHNHYQSPIGSHVYERYASCKESVRGMEHLILDNLSLNMEQFAPYVAS